MFILKEADRLRRKEGKVQLGEKFKRGAKKISTKAAALSASVYYRKVNKQFFPLFLFAKYVETGDNFCESFRLKLQCLF